jgi:serine/threonine-protein kinase RsbW
LTVPLVVVPPLKRSARARPDVIAGLRHDVVAYARRLGAERSVCDAVALAVSEALNNAVIHAYVGRPPGRLRVESHHDGDGQLIVRVIDEGAGMVPRTDSPGLGLGMSLMAQMADDLRVTTRPEAPGTVVAMQFSLTAGAQNAPSP